MAKLKFEIDTDEIFQDYSEEFGLTGASFEDLFKTGLETQIKNQVAEKVSKAQIEEVTDRIRDSVYEAVENKLEALISEEVAISDRWGKPTFVGSVEDYIKKQIDEKMLAPVDSSGKTVHGCSSSSKTWVEWRVEHALKGTVASIKDTVEKTGRDFCRKILLEELEEFKTKTMRGQIINHLDSIGVIKDGN